MNNLKILISKIHKRYPNGKIVIIGVFTPLPNYQSQIKAYNLEMSKFSKENKQYLTYLNNQDLQNPKNFTPDLIHPNNAGYKVIALKLLKVIK